MQEGPCWQALLLLAVPLLLLLLRVLPPLLQVVACLGARLPLRALLLPVPAEGVKQGGQPQRPFGGGVHPGQLGEQPPQLEHHHCPQGLQLLQEVCGRHPGALGEVAAGRGVPGHLLQLLRLLPLLVLARRPGAQQQQQLQQAAARRQRLLLLPCGVEARVQTARAGGAAPCAAEGAGALVGAGAQGTG